MLLKKKHVAKIAVDLLKKLAVPDFAMVIGNPGKVVAWVDKKGSKLVFNNEGKIIC